MAEAMPGLTPGRIVHYVVPAGEFHAAAVVSRVDDAAAGQVTLPVFNPRANGGIEGPVVVVERVPHSETPAPLTWHWIERA